ncbi:MAG: dienelactone hydrolase family protein, partial [Alphaproteobacteria bacterium]|nr:dienelactone hydrolase family protein [Alphaproteobacteria bacterium]
MDGLVKQHDWIDQRVFDLYDEYCHGRIDRRSFLQQAALVAGG